MGEEFRLRIVGRDSTDDVPDSSKVPVVTRSQLGVLPDASLLYWGAGNALVFAEPGARGLSRRCFVQGGLAVWHVAVSPDRTFAVIDDGNYEGAEIAVWIVPLTQPRLR